MQRATALPAVVSCFRGLGGAFVVDRLVELPKQERREAENIETILAIDGPVESGLMRRGIPDSLHQSSSQELHSILHIPISVSQAWRELQGSLFRSPDVEHQSLPILPAMGLLFDIYVKRLCCFKDRMEVVPL